VYSAAALRHAEKSPSKALPGGHGYCEPSSVPQGSRFGTLIKARHGAVGDVRGQPGGQHFVDPPVSFLPLFLRRGFGRVVVECTAFVKFSQTPWEELMTLCERCAERAKFLFKLTRAGAGGKPEECMAAFCSDPCKATGMADREREGWRYDEPPVIPPP